MSRSKRKNSKRKQGVRGQYANHFRVGHNAYEFVIDFGQLYEGDDKALILTRIITSPRYAKDLRNILSESLDTYEQTFGPIRED